MGSAGSGGSAAGGHVGSGGGVVASGGSSAGGSSTGGVGGSAAGGKAAGGNPGTGSGGAGGRAAGGNGGKATGGTSSGGAGGRASGGAPGTGGVTSTGGSAGHAAGGSPGTGGTAPDCATLAKQYDAEMQKYAKNCTTNTIGACALKVPQDLVCQNSCITWVEDSSGRLQQIYKMWQDAGCLKRAEICAMLVACSNPRGATCVADIISTDTPTSAAAVAPAIGLPGTCQDDRVATTQ